MTWDEEELEPRREWTPELRLRVATWALVFLNVLGVLMLAPIGDGGLQQAADAAGVDDGAVRQGYWIAILAATLVGNGVGAAAAAMRRRWAIAGPLLALVGCWTAFAVATASL
ncbi:hypothetical protein OVA14_05735 [Agrococcus sp. SL85]|uniref:hypothetical protein n=1 Tax=Agrococcus sp. SL85 TaxID=2995141 RepID=UPI00226C9400|nr:hypothetical protein [Agrococcus sp. SL85]WAC67238.1 hypothetical protein OVA14_05735 [Agrococcus sp. SL85]